MSEFIFTGLNNLEVKQANKGKCFLNQQCCRIINKIGCFYLEKTGLYLSDRGFLNVLKGCHKFNKVV